MTTELEILDTAVKVGLGALISGVTTYFVTMRNHSHEIRKSFLNEKKELLKEAAVKFELCSTLCNEVTDDIYRISTSNSPDKDKKFGEAMKTFTAAVNRVKEARSLFILSGKPEIAKLASDYFNAIEEERIYYEENSLNYDVTFLDNLTKKQTIIRDQMLDKLSDAFADIYS